MNYLAHIFLSGNDEEVQLGSFIADAVKGSSYNNYPDGVRRGIIQHRQIDYYTDRHSAVKEIVHSLRPRFGRYSGILADIYFDFLLASNFSEFSEVPLKKFSKRFYRTLIKKRRHLPPKFRRFMWHFILTDRLTRYSTIEGIRESLSIMVKYRHLNISVEEAVDYLVDNEASLWLKFKPFFEELKKLHDSDTV